MAHFIIAILFILLTACGNDPEYYSDNAPPVEAPPAPAPAPAPDPTLRYTVLNDESIVLDKETGLEWQRCAIGQFWSPTLQACEGTALRMNIDTAYSYQTSGIDGWRIPTLPELQTLIYCSDGLPDYFPASACSGVHDVPVILAELFPNTSIVGAYLTSTTSSILLDGQVVLTWKVMSFDDGSSCCSVRNNTNLQLHLRLVRHPII